MDVLCLAVIVLFSLDLVLTWEQYAECREPVQVWVLMSLPSVVVLRGVQLVAYEQSEDGLPWIWRYMVVFLPYHWLAFYAVQMVFLVYWAIQGTLWYVELVTVPTPCTDLLLIMVWLFLLYSAVIFYLTLELIGFITLCTSWSIIEDTDSDRLLDHYDIPSSPLHSLDSTDCSICLHTLQSTQPLSQLPCGHQYHTSCIDPWISRNAVCPTCQQEIS